MVSMWGLVGVEASGIFKIGVYTLTKTIKTGAGKGDSPRKINGERYRKNYERIFKHRQAKDKARKVALNGEQIPFKA